MLDVERVRASLRQQLDGDRRLGINSVPCTPVAAPLSRGPAGQAGAAGPAVDVSETTASGGKSAELRALDAGQVKDCRKCRLCETRTQTVFGQGSPDARVIFVGEAPGFDEDRQGLAFVGRAGQLLTRMITAMGLTRDEVYICNVIKCRPPSNREPAADEILACSPYLRRQLEIIQPEVLVALGAPAAKTLLNTADSIGKLRGRFHDYFFSGIGGTGASVPLMPTYHPAYLLRNPDEKGKTWEDLQMVMHLLGLPVPQRKPN